MAVRACIDANVPVLLWGPPGVGKSSALAAMAADAGRGMEVVLGSVREASDFAGLPIVQPDGRSVVMAPPDWALRLAEAEGGWLFLDDVTTTAPSVQKAMLQVVLDRKVGDLALPPAVRVIGAANEVDDAPDGSDLAPALANRWAHFQVGPDASEFCDGLTLGWAALTQRASAAEGIEPTPERVAKARAEVAGFLRHRPILVHAKPDNAVAAGRAWPSYRTWKWVADVLPRLDPPVDPATGGDNGVGLRAQAARMAIAGLVGEGAAVEFLTWRRDADLPDPETVLADPEAFDWTGRADRTWAVLSSVVAVVAVRPSTARWTAAWRVLGACATSGSADVGAAAAVALGRCRPAGAGYPAAIRAFAPVMAAAGLLDDAQ
jgi:hypothetical protein